MSLIGKVPLNLDFDLFTSIYSERLNLIISVIPYIDILKVAHHDSMVEVVVLLFTVVRNASLVPRVGSQIDGLSHVGLECHGVPCTLRTANTLPDPRIL